MEQLALIVKVQATIRGYLTRKKVRIAQMNMGMGAHYYDPEVQVNEDYDNPKVQQIREELGEFDYDEEPNHGDHMTEYRPMVELENHAKYDGEWIQGRDIR